MNYGRQMALLITLLWLVTGCYGAAPNYGSANIAHLVPYDIGVDQCYGLTADDVTPILGEPVTPTYDADHRQGHCIFVSASASDFAWGENEYLLTYGPAHEHQYVAIAVRPNDIFAEDEYTDPMDYGVGKPLLTFATKLFNDEARYEQFWANFDQRTEGDAKKNPAPMLRELATVPSRRTTLQRDFLPTMGDGAFWYWQAAKSGHHLAGLYAFINGEQIALQALVAPQQSEAETQAQMVKLVEYLHALGKSAPETRYVNKKATPLSADNPIWAYTDCCQLLMTSIKKEPTGVLVATFIVNRR